MGCFLFILCVSNLIISGKTWSNIKSKDSFEKAEILGISELSLLLIFEHTLPEIIQIEQTKGKKKTGPF